MDTKLHKIIKDYLKEAKLMQVATSVDNQPWVCSVWFAADDDLNIYFISSTTRRHSDEVLKNNKVAGAIVVPHIPTDPPRGLQFQGIAELVEDQGEVDKTMSLYAGRIFPKEQVEEFMNDPETPHKFYKIKPTHFVLFDAVNLPEDSRQELFLSDIG